MNTPLDTENLAKQDIIARPEVTGEGGKPKKNKDKAQKNSANSAKNDAIEPKVEVLEPGPLELAAGKVLSKTADELRKHLGAESDPDFSILLSEVLSGGFAAIRFMTGRPWIRFAVAGGALTLALIPPVLRYRKTKQESEKDANE